MSKRVSGTGSVSVGSRYSITAGCDVDKNFVVVGIYNVEREEIVTQEFEQTHKGAAEAVHWLLESSVEVAVLESTAQYHMLFYDALRMAGITTHVINPMLIKSLLRVEGKSDKGDAATLARLAASFNLRVSNMPDSQQRMIRLCLRGLDALKNERTRITNRTNSALTAAGVTVFRLIDLNSVSGLGFCKGIVEGLSRNEIVYKYWKGRKNRIDELISCIPDEIPDYLRRWLKTQVDDINRLNGRIADQEFEAHMLIDELGLAQQIAIMCTAPAISPLLALRIIGEMGQDYWIRYHSADAFAKAIGVVPANEVSGGKIVKKKSSKGNVHVKTHLLNSVKSWLLHASPEMELKRWYINYRHRATYAKGVSAVARQIAEQLWWMGTKNSIYREKRDLKSHTPPPTLILLMMLREK